MSSFFQSNFFVVGGLVLAVVLLALFIRVLFVFFRNEEVYYMIPIGDVKHCQNPFSIRIKNGVVDICYNGGQWKEKLQPGVFGLQEILKIARSRSSGAGIIMMNFLPPPHMRAMFPGFPIKRIRISRSKHLEFTGEKIVK